MPYIGKKPENIIATAIDSTTGDFSGNVTAGGTLGVTGIGTFTDDIIIGDGKTIGSASDVDAMTIASNGQVTFSQTLIGTALDISGDIDVDGTTNLDVVDIDGAVDMATTLNVTGNITSSGFMTITTTGNNDQITLTSTDADANSGPHLALFRNSGSPAADDFLGGIKFFGENNASQATTYATVTARIEDVTDGAEDGRLALKTMRAGSLRSAIDCRIDAIIVNDDGDDVDFRVESDSNAAMFFVNGGTNRIGINTDGPQCQIHSANSGSNALRVSGSANNNAKVEIGFDTSNGAYLKAGSSVETKLQFYVDNTSLAGEFRSNGDFYTNDGTVHSLSDSRIKKDIADLTDGLDIVNQLKPRTFKYNGKATTLDDDRTRYGFVADEVMAIASQYVSEETQTIDDVEVDDFKSLSTTKMIPMLVKAIQELSTKNEALTARIVTLENA